MADTPRITIRVPASILAALADRAGDRPVSTYAAQVLANHVGLPLGDRSQGFAAMSDVEVRRASRAGHKALRGSKK